MFFRPRAVLRASQFAAGYGCRVGGAQSTVLTAEAPDLWKSLPAELAEPFRARLPRLAAAVAREIRAVVPEFSRPERSTSGLAIRLGVERALAEFADRLAEGRGSPAALDAPGDRCSPRIFGGGQMRHRAALDAVQAALRVGARMTWQCLARIGVEAEVDPRRMYYVAEAVFVYGEELADQARAAHAQARALTDRELLRRRRRLLEQLTSVPGPSRGAVSELARSAQWPLPAAVRVVALRRLGGATAPDLTGSFLSVRPEALVSADRDEPFLILPESGGRALPSLERELSGWRAAVGPPVALEDAGRSLRWARRLLDLAQRGAVKPPSALLRCSEHLPELILTADETLMRALVDRRLAPLGAVAAARRARLAETLLSWLECRGSAPEVARRLGVHPQTVRYRLRQLEELFGDALNAPDARFELELALRGRALLPAVEPGG